jgi:nucleotide-binding universal stress UspA family protein
MTSSKIVLGYDGTSESRDALRLAAGLAGVDRSEIVVVTSYELPALPVTVADDDSDLVAGAEKTLAEAQSELEGRVVHPRVVASSSPSRALHDIAEAEQAAVVVVGSSHRAGIGRVMPGSTGERLLHGAPCAVAVAPRGYARGEHSGLGLIGVGYDGGDEARLALALARRLAAALAAELRIIGVLPEGTQGKKREELRTELEGRLDEAANFARREDADGRTVQVERVVREGKPADALAEDGIELDLLVIGSRGYGPVLRTLLGGVSDRVIRIAPCPVLVVPRGEGSHPGLDRALDRLLALG